MLVSEEHIIEEREISERELGGETPGVRLRHNQTNPDLIADGVDRIAIIEESDDAYRIDFWGYSYGRLVVRPEGIEELAADYLSTDEQIPRWTVVPETVDADELPWWLPEDIEIDPQVTCERCRADVSVQQVVTPVDRPDTEDVLCRECWDELRS